MSFGAKGKAQRNEKGGKDRENCYWSRSKKDPERDSNSLFRWTDQERGFVEGEGEDGCSNDRRGVMPNLENGQRFTRKF